MVIRDLLVRIKDAWVREPEMIKRYYHGTLPVKSQVRNAYVFMVDGKIPHGGMFDRLKGLITVYAIAKSKKYLFAFISLIRSVWRSTLSLTIIIGS